VSEKKARSGATKPEPTSLDPPAFEEAVGALIRVKKPEPDAKPKKAQSRERKKRNVDPRA
jgi:hypothetical protein